MVRSTMLLAVVVLTLMQTLVAPVLAVPTADDPPEVIMTPEGGRLDALDKEGNVMGPCPLRHTNVEVQISGPFTRVTVTQQYENTYADKIEAVYTFPLSHRAAVDRMTMTVGDRVVIGEVKERGEARAIYEAARQQGYVASLLEQERPNIFTQSVANIEPGEEVTVNISYVETLESKDGLYSFEFPMVVGPRYIPGSMRTAELKLPDGLQARTGLILQCPARLTVGQQGEIGQLGTLQEGKLTALIHAAVPIAMPGQTWWQKPSPESSEPQSAAQPVVWCHFEAEYPNGSKELGTVHTDGTGQLNGRWFYTDVNVIKGMGAGFAPDTTQVPDASKITPMPVKPGQRAGHDISVRVTIDTGGPGIKEYKSVLHEVIETEAVRGEAGLPRKLALQLKQSAEIPNRDFVLQWRLTADTIQEAMLTHTGKHGNFFTLILQPPDRVADTQAVARELIFVLDTSGSMSGFPVEKAKQVMSKAIDSLRPQDTFNLITFAGDTTILWEKPRPFTEQNRQEAQQFLASRQGRGGTEMMKAIEAALVQTVDGPIRVVCFMTDGYVGNDMQIIDAAKKNARTTRVFSFGIGNSVNRYLLDGMARAGRGEAEYVLLESDGDEAAQRFAKRIQTPVLTDVQISFIDLKITDVLPGTIPDLFDTKPLVIHGRYSESGKGKVTIRGMTGSGTYERVLDLDLPAEQPDHDTIATLWARTRIEDLMNNDLAAAQSGTFPDELRQQVIALGTEFQIMSQFTSFVAVERARVTIGGQPRLVAVPIEMPQGVSYEGIFGGCQGAADMTKALTGQLREAVGAAQSDKKRELETRLGDARLSRTATAGAPMTVAQSGRAPGQPSTHYYGRFGGSGANQLASSGRAMPCEMAPTRGTFKAGADQYGYPAASATPSRAAPSSVGVPPPQNAMIVADALEMPSVQEPVPENADLADLLGKLDSDAGREWARETHLHEYMLLVVEALVREGDLTGAGKLASVLARFDPGYAPGVTAGQLLADKSLAPADREKKIADLTADAHKVLDAAARKAKIAARLDPRLQKIVEAPETISADERITLRNGQLLVSVRMAELNDAALQALTEAGLKIGATVPSVNLVVGELPPARLADAALVDAVRRITPADPE